MHDGHRCPAPARGACGLIGRVSQVTYLSLGDRRAEAGNLQLLTKGQSGRAPPAADAASGDRLEPRSPERRPACSLAARAEACPPRQLPAASRGRSIETDSYGLPSRSSQKGGAGSSANGSTSWRLSMRTFAPRWISASPARRPPRVSSSPACWVLTGRCADTSARGSAGFAPSSSWSGDRDSHGLAAGPGRDLSRRLLSVAVQQLSANVGHCRSGPFAGQSAYHATGPGRARRQHCEPDTATPRAARMFVLVFLSDSDSGVGGCGLA
jgi:hypothetical protein